MSRKRPLNRSRQDYTEEELYSARQRKIWKENIYPDGPFSYSEIGGEKMNQRNSWQGSQSKPTVE
jgi:hypothetical protein